MWDMTSISSRMRCVWSWYDIAWEVRWHVNRSLPDMGEAGGGLVVITELPHSPPVYDWGDGSPDRWQRRSLTTLVVCIHACYVTPLHKYCTSVQPSVPGSQLQPPSVNISSSNSQLLWHRRIKDYHSGLYCFHLSPACIVLHLFLFT